MWALRRASMRFKNRGLSSPSPKILCANSNIGQAFSENHNITTIESQGKLFDELSPITRFYNTSLSSFIMHTTVCTFSSQAVADAEDAFSELGALIQSSDDLIPETKVADELDILGSDFDNKSPKDPGVLDMTKVILDAPTSSVGKVMDIWVRQGNEVTQIEASLTMIHLRRRKLFMKALKLSEWLESTKRIEFAECHYAARIDLIARARGVTKAEEYLKSIPESLRGDLVYRTLLANCVSVADIKRSEELFDKMKGLGLTTCSTCNLMLLLYQKVDTNKIADMQSLMYEENIRPSLSTYHILINAKGLNSDINGMEQIVETMMSEGHKPNLDVKTSVARHYAAAGLKDQAIAISREIEGGDLGKRRRVCKLLLPIYASLGNEKDVERIWKLCEESNAQLDECTAAIEAWGLLGKIDKAEVAFEELMQKVKNPSSKHYISMLKVYVNHKMLSEGKDLMRRMVESGCRIGPGTRELLVELEKLKRLML